MMMDKRYEELLERYMTGVATVEEQLELQAWYDLKNQEEVVWPAVTADEEVLVRSRMLANINARRQVVAGPKQRSVVLWRKWVAAAAIVLVVFSGGYFYYQNQIFTSSLVSNQNDIAPGKDGATLTLADGRRISIADALAGNVATQSGVRISKTADGEIVYEVVPDDGKVVSYNTLMTTRGEQTRLRLPDGTLVFLNSASSLKYPTVFVGERKVELTGEAYFEVAHDKKKPFKVLSGGQEVKVLGTHFNVNSYGDEKVVRTTLLEGSVSVSSLLGKRASHVIRPDQQAALSASGEVMVKEVNADEVIAWTNGKFIFENESIESIMRTLSRWYDVEVVYEGDVKDKKFAGTLSRREHISKILEKITFTQAARFRIEGRRVIVMP